MTSDDGQPPAGGVTAVLGERAAVTGLAYRMLGSWADAEDVFQSTLERWLGLGEDARRRIESPGAWCRTVASRICLDQLRSARHRREVYVGEWLPEPIPGDDIPGSEDPGTIAAVDESVTMAFLVVLDTMTPAERVSFVLHDVYDYPFADVARVLGRSSAACRKLATSARRRVRDYVPSPRRRRSDSRVVHRFQQAWARQDVAELLTLLDPEVSVIADGGGVATAARRPVVGAQRVARFLVGMAAKWDESGEETIVNGLPGLIVRHGPEVSTVYAVEVIDERVRRIWAMRNPAKLSRWSRD